MTFLMNDSLTVNLFRPAAQYNVCWRDRPVRDRQDSHSARQLKALRAGRARIEEQDGARPLGLWLMRVAEDADIGLFTIQERSSLFGQLPAFVENVSDRNSPSSQFDHSCRGKTAPFIAIHVAGDGSDRRQLLKF